MSKLSMPALLLASISCLTGCQDPAGPGSQLAPVASLAQGGPVRSEWIGSDFDFRDLGFPIELDCLGETVLWTGIVHYDDHWVYRPDGTFHLNGQATLPPGNMLVGASGTWTPVHVVSFYNFDMVVQDLQGPARIAERITWENQASGERMAVSLNVHFVYDGKGLPVRQTPWAYHCELEP